MEPGFVGLAVALLARPSRQAARRLYLSSLAYLALLFVAMALDRLSYRLPAVDRERARANIRAGMVASCLALLVFALAFYVAILYLR